MDSEPNVVVKQKLEEKKQELYSTFDYYFRAYAPESVRHTVDSFISKKDSLNQAVKEKIDDVFGTCERIMDYYIPDEQCDRPEYGKDYDVFSRMSDFSHDFSARICRRFLPFVAQHVESEQDAQEEQNVPQKKAKEGKSKLRPSLQSLKEPFLKVKDQCFETVKPVVTPFSPIITPLFSLIVLFFTTLRLAFYTIFIDPLLYLFQKLKSFITAGKHEFIPDANGKVPVVSLAEDLYAKASNEVIDLFTDDAGHITLTKFQQLCKDKSAEYQQLLHDHVTPESLQAFLNSRGNEVKDAVDARLMEPVRQAGMEGKVYTQQLVELFTDEAGNFSVAKIQAMAGKSGNELKGALGKAREMWESGKREVMEKAKGAIEAGRSDVAERAKEWNGAMQRNVEVAKKRALSSMSVVMGIVCLFPTIGVLMTVFVLSYVVDVRTILPEEEGEEREDVIVQPAENLNE